MPFLVLKHLRVYWWVWLFVLGTLFAFPYQMGIKTDPSVYGALAERVSATGIWWPLSLMPDFFERFYDSPPGVVWGMAAVFKVFPSNTWTVSLFSRLCVLLTYFCFLELCFSIGKRVLKLDSQKQLLALGTVGILLLHTWMGWLKYAGSGQLEGPNALGIMLFTLGLVWSGDAKKRLVYLLLFGLVLGFLCCFIRGVFFLPFLAGAFFWALLYRRTKALLFCIVFTAGFLSAVGALWAMDAQYETAFLSTYVHKQIIQRVLNPSAPSLAIFGRVLATSWNWLKTEMRFSPLWMAPVLVLFFSQVFRKRTWQEPLLALFLLLFIAFASVLLLAADKMPHWSLSLYPVATLVAIGLLPKKFSVRLVSRVEGFRGGPAVVLVVILIGVLPIPRSGKYYRGQDWEFHAPFLKAHATPETPVLLFKDRIELDWPGFQYAKFYLSSATPLKTVTAGELEGNSCKTGSVLVVPGPYASDEKTTQLRSVGYHPTFHQYGGMRVYTCD